MNSDDNSDNDANLSDTAKAYKHAVASLLDKDDPRTRSGGSHADERECVHIDDHDTMEIVDAADEHNEEDEDFEDDYPISDMEVDNPDEDVIVPKKNCPLERRWEEMIHLRNFIYPFNADRLNLFHLAIIYSALANVQGRSPLYDVIVLFIFILIHTGLKPVYLNHLEIGSRVPDYDVPVLQLMGNRYYICVPLIVRRKLQVPCEGCHRVRDSVLIPMPDKICEMIGKISLPSEGPVFSYQKGGERIKVDLDQIAAFLKEKVNESALYAKYDLRITITRISRSLPAVHSSQFGLDNIVSAILRANKAERLYRSQAHYVYIPRKDFEHHIIDVFKPVDEAIIDNAKLCAQWGIIPQIDEAAVIMTPDTTMMGDDYPDEGYGSSIIPPLEIIKPIIDTLVKEIYRTRNIVRFNLLSIYVFLCLQFSVGRRPDKVKEIVFGDCNFRTGHIVIRDKNTRQNNEERILVLPPVTCSLLQMLQGEIEFIRWHIEHNMNDSIRFNKSDSLFFLCTEDGEIQDFTFSRAVKHLQAAGIDYPFRRNMPRVFYSNELYHSGICQESIDCQMGHAHEGRESFNLASSTSLDWAVTHSLPIIIEMLKKLGFREVHLNSRRKMS
jgi:hypothetical protein